MPPPDKAPRRTRELSDPADAIVLARGIPVAGAIPEGYEGLYTPSATEIREGLRVMLEASLEDARQAAAVMASHMDVLLSEEGKGE